MAHGPPHQPYPQYPRSGPMPQNYSHTRLNSQDPYDTTDAYHRYHDPHTAQHPHHHTNGWHNPPVASSSQSTLRGPADGQAYAPSYSQANPHYAAPSWPQEEPSPPPLPPQNSYWHRQVEPAPSPPPSGDQNRNQVNDSEHFSSWQAAPSPSPSRPVSSATGIIALYADDERRTSDAFAEADAPKASRRVSRPLPTLPDHSSPPSSSSRAAAPALAAPKPNHLGLPAVNEAAFPRSVSPYAPVTTLAAPSPLPYYSGDPTHQGTPVRALDGYFNDEASPSHSKHGPGTGDPMWSPASSSFASAQTSPAVGTSHPSLHRSQNSLGALSALSSDSWISGDGYAPRHLPSASHDGSFRQQEQVPHLHVDTDHSSASSSPTATRGQTVKRRAPLPAVPAHRPVGSSSFNNPEDFYGSVSSTATVRPSDVRQDSWSSATVGPRSPSSLTPVSNQPASLHSSVYSQPSRRDTLRPQTPREAHISRTSFVDFSLLSHLALLLKDALPRASHVKGSISYPSSFTGKDVVTAVQFLLPLDRASAAVGIDVNRSEEAQGQAKLRSVAFSLARSLKAQLFFNEVDWRDAEPLQDGVDEVYQFPEDSVARNADNGGSDTPQSNEDEISFGDDPLDLSLSFGKRASMAQKRDHPVSSSDYEELPTGVFVPLTSCYSPLCGRSDASPNSGCYSPSCPRSRNSLLQRADSATMPKLAKDTPALAGAAGGVAHKAWAELVPAEVLASLPKSEITRQNAILEHIQKEEDFLADLQLLGDLFIAGLEKPSPSGDPPPIPIGPERDDFIKEVFGNFRELIGHVKNFVERLHIRQREESPIIRSIGDIFLEAALEWQDAFVTYVSAYPIAKSRIGREQTVNPRFRDFLERCRREPACRRLGLDNFIHRALPHLQRHPLLLQTIIDKTDETNSDRESCIQAKEVIVEQCKTADTSIQAAQIRAKIRNFAYNLQTKRNKAVVDMELLDANRQLMHEGRVYRRPDFTELDWTELQAVLFDNYFMITKLKQKSDGGEDASTFVLAKRPIPVEMLEVSGFNEPSVSFSLGLNALHIRSDRESRSLWPLTIHHIGGKLEPLTLYVTSKQRRLEWRNKIEEAKTYRMSAVDAARAFDTVELCDQVFAVPSATTGIDPDRPLPGADASLFHGRITCAVPFRMVDERRLIAIGCADGVFIGLHNDPSSFRKVLHLRYVTQCAVLEEFGIFVVLADKVLIAYSLEALVPTSTGSGASSTRPPQQLSGNRGVLFFGVGVLRERTLLVYMKKKANESVFKALEPVINQGNNSSGRSGGNLFSRLRSDIGGRGTDLFRMYKVFFIPSEAYTMQFLRSKLAVVCARGFEIMNLDTLLPGTIPDFSRCPRDDPRILALARRVETAKPLGMFKLAGTDSDFLLCYDAFACYVDRSGEPIRLDSVVEWEGTPQSVAFSAPYILAFDSHFVEVREALSGRLVQIIRGNDMRYLSSVGVVEGSQNSGSGLICMHRVRPAAASSANGSSGPPSASAGAYDSQKVFELVPTRPQLLARQDTTATTSTGLLSHSGTMHSTRSRNQTSESSISASSAPGGHHPPPPTRQPPSQAAQLQQQYLQQQGFATRTILPDPPAPAGWI